MVLETKENLTTIAVSKRNHLILEALGKKGQTFDDVLTELLSVVIEPQYENKTPKKKFSNNISQNSQECDFDHE